MKIKVQLAPGATLLQKYTKGAAGFDLSYHSVDPEKQSIKLTSCYTHVLGTGVAVEIPPTHFGLIRLRSGWAKKNQMVMVSSGVIDPDYRGELMAPVMYLGQAYGNMLPHIKLGDRFAQLLILPIPEVELEVVEHLSDSERGTGGFGSTDTIDHQERTPIPPGALYIKGFVTPEVMELLKKAKLFQGPIKLIEET